MKEPDAGPETTAPEWSRPQRASEPLPAPPSGYKFAAPDYLYAPRQDEEPAPEAPSEVAAPVPVPAMVWSEARSKWEPATPPAPAPPAAAPPPVLPPPQPSPFPPLAPRSQPPPRRRRKARWVATIVVAFFVISRMAAGVNGALSDGDSGPTVAVPFPAFTGLPATPAPAPSATVPVPAKPLAVMTSVADLLGTQIAGVRAGSESWFMSTVDPTAKAAVDTYKLMFQNVRALRATDFAESSLDSDPIPAKTWIHVNVAFCIGRTTSPCTLASADLDVQVGPRGQGVAIEAVSPAANFDRVAPPPWLATPLTATPAGDVLIVGTPDTRSRIPEMIKAAEVAGARADQYAPTGTAPRPYVVYLATHADVTAWFGDGLGRISHGFVASSIGQAQAVLALPDATQKRPLGGDGLTADLQRALATMSLTTNYDTPFQVDSLGLGIQEYAAYDGLLGADADTLAPVAKYVNGGAWNHSCYYTYDTPAGLDAMPGVGLLAIRYLVQEFGIDKVVDFWTAVERTGELPDSASIEHLDNMSWLDVDQECAAYVTNAVNP